MELINKKEVDKIFTSQKKVLIEFYAKWCPPCRMLGLVLDEFLEEHPEIDFYQIDSNLLKDVAIEYRAVAVPVLFVVENGQVIGRHDGFFEVEDIEKWYQNPALLD